MDLPVYPNLAAQIALTAINQLWVADITYIRLRTEFIYLAVVLDLSPAVHHSDRECGMLRTAIPSYLSSIKRKSA